MELLFLYIDQFRGIKKQSFAFASDLEFVLTERQIGSIGHSFDLQISERPIHVNLFGEKILNVTGIIGKNGAGKSTLIDALKLMCGNLGKLNAALIFCVRDNASGRLLTCFYNGGVKSLPSLMVRPHYDDYVESSYPIRECEGYQVKSQNVVENLLVDFKVLNLCFFSNAFDSRSELLYDNVLNLSTNYRLEQFLRQYIKKIRREYPDKEILSVDPITTHIGEFHKSELKSMFSFLSYAKTRSTHRIPDLPESVIFYFDFDDYDFLVNDSESPMRRNVEIMKKINDRALKSVRSSRDKVQNFMDLLHLSIFYDIIRRDKLLPEHFTFPGLFEGLIDDSHDFFLIIRDVIAQSSFSGKNRRTKNFNIMKVLSPDFMSQLQDVEFISLDETDSAIVSYQFGINAQLWPVLSLVHELTESDGNFFMNYQWSGGLSTGQEAFIRHFARLHDVKRIVKSKPIWLLIDEGDLHFHPEMQKEYFSELLAFVSFLFPRNDVQIIMATHSPFIVSDLPKQNLIFLKKENGQCVVDDENLRSETFGANIHDLFKDTLFLSGTLMGDFAKQKIDDVLKLTLSHKDMQLSENTVKYIRSFIQLIGEPIIKTKLAEMLALKLGDNQELARLEEQRNYILKRIEEIKSKSNDSN